VACARVVAGRSDHRAAVPAGFAAAACVVTAGAPALIVAATGTEVVVEERYAKRLPVRLKHSKLGAFWHTDFGPLNQVIHVYPYDDLNQRAAVREA
jgi:hypothetical protein